MSAKDDTFAPSSHICAFSDSALMLEEQIILECGSSDVGKYWAFIELMRIGAKSIDDIVIIKYIYHGNLRIGYT